MKKFYPYVVLILIFISCKKQDLSHSSQQPEEKPDFIELPSRPNPGRYAQVQSGASVIFLDFDGQGVSGTAWNDANNPVIYADPSIETAQQQANTLNFVKERYSTFNVTVTTDSTVYWAADQFHRIRCILTPTWQWYTQTGGVAFINSFSWGTNEVCWAFETGNLDVMTYRATHEIGHTLGLYHQSTYNQSCVKTAEYSTGNINNGAVTWAPLMGASWNLNLQTFTVGPDSRGCNSIVDEYAVMNNVISNKADDVIDDFTTDEFLPNNQAQTYQLQTASDVDMFVIPTGKWSCAITVTTFGTTDIAVDVYDANHNYKGSIDPNSSAGIPRTSVGGAIQGYLPKFFRVRNTTNNLNVPPGSLRGTYTIKAEY